MADEAMFREHRSPLTEGGLHQRGLPAGLGDVPGRRGEQDQPPVQQRLQRREHGPGDGERRTRLVEAAQLDQPEAALQQPLLPLVGLGRRGPVQQGERLLRPVLRKQVGCEVELRSGRARVGGDSLDQKRLGRFRPAGQPEIRGEVGGGSGGPGVGVEGCLRRLDGSEDVAAVVARDAQVQPRGGEARRQPGRPAVRLGSPVQQRGGEIGLPQHVMRRGLVRRTQAALAGGEDGAGDVPGCQQRRGQVERGRRVIGQAGMRQAEQRDGRRVLAVRLQADGEMQHGPRVLRR